MVVDSFRPATNGVEDRDEFRLTGELAKPNGELEHSTNSSPGSPPER